MALGSIPPWLNIQPNDFLQATQSGAQAGLAIAEMRQRSVERAQAIAEARVRRQQEAWEFGERMRQAAVEAAALREYRQGQLSGNEADRLAMMDYRNRALSSTAERAGIDDALAKERFQEERRHNIATEGISMQRAEEAVKTGKAEIVSHPEAPGMLFLRQPNTGHETLISPTKKTDPDDFYTVTERIEESPGIPGTPEVPAQKRKLGGIDWLRKDIPHQPAMPEVPAHGDYTITRKVPSGMGIPGIPNLAPLGPSAPAAPSEGTRVRVRDPKGKTGTVAAENLEEALAAGYTRL